MKKTALLDCDGVLSDFVGGVFSLVHQHTGLDLKPEDVVTEWGFLEGLADILRGAGVPHPETTAALVKKGIFEEGFVENLQPLPGAVEAVQRLSTKYDVVILTSPFYSSKFWMYERTSWCQKHLGIPGPRVMHGFLKHLVKGDLFLDDKPSSVAAWAQAWGHDTPACSPALLWNTYQNAPVNLTQEEKVLRRIYSWDEMFEIAGV